MYPSQKKGNRVTGKVVNLRRARKARARAADRAEADRNALRCGLPKAERTRVKVEEDRRLARLDAHRRESDDEI